jgi:hypothetical protein
VLKDKMERAEDAATEALRQDNEDVGRTEAPDAFGDGDRETGSRCKGFSVVFRVVIVLMLGAIP